MSTTPEHVVELRALERMQIRSLDEPVIDEAGAEHTLAELLPANIEPPDCVFDRELMRASIGAALDKLLPRERVIVAMLFGLDEGEPMSYGALAWALGLHPSTVRLCAARALESLRRVLKDPR